MSPIADEAERSRVQRRTLRTLFATQILGGVGSAVGASVGALLTADMVGVGLSGLAQSAAVIGAAVLAIPATRILRQSGRRWSLAFAYLVATLGGALVMIGGMVRSVPLLFAGLFAFGGGSTASYQARYAAVDLAPADARGRQLSLVVWATTIGAVAGPNLAPLSGTLLAPYGIPPLAAPFAFAAILLAVAAAQLLIFLRPDPFLLAQEGRRGEASSAPHTIGLVPALRLVAAIPGARLGMAATAVGHLVMVGVMSMTPVHIMGAGHDTAMTLRIVGVVLSLHIAGMFALSPLMGWMTDRFGRPPVITGGILLLLVACGVAGTAGYDSVRLSIGLTLLGLGWSATMVAGSTLLSESVSLELRPSAQGLADIVMGLAGATGGALSGLVVQLGGYGWLNLAAALSTLPLALAMRASAGTNAASHSLATSSKAPKSEKAGVNPSPGHIPSIRRITEKRGRRALDRVSG